MAMDLAQPERAIPCSARVAFWEGENVNGMPQFGIILFYSLRTRRVSRPEVGKYVLWGCFMFA